MHDTIPRLEAFIKILLNQAEKLNDVRVRLAHKDLHFANILDDFKSNKVTVIRG